MVIYIYLFMVCSMALFWWAIFGVSFSKEGRPKLPEAQPEIKRKRLQAFLSHIFPFSQKILEKLKLYEKLRNKINFAHLKILPVAFFNLKLLFIILLCVLVKVLLGKSELWLFALCIIFGYVIPDIYLNRIIAKRKYLISRLLPETVDLLGLCVEAGLDFVSAVKWLIEKTPHNPMVEEMAFVLEEISWGKPRSQALKDMSKRLNILEVTSFVQSLVLAERMGTPVAEAFTILSEDTRLQRFHRGERIAMQAPIKILIPLIFCILPVIGIIVAGPILLQFGSSGALAGFGK